MCVCVDNSENLKSEKIQTTDAHLKATVVFLVSPPFKSPVLEANVKHMEDLVHHRLHDSVCARSRMTACAHVSVCI